MPVKFFFSNTKAWIKTSLYAQMLIVALAFSLMIFISYQFVSDIERKHLQRNIRDAISNTETNIKADMLEPETLLAGIAETMRSMILRGINAKMMRDYIQYLNNYMQNNQDKRLLGVNGFYGVFDAYGGIFITGEMDWKPPDDYVIQDRPWYIAAVDADGDVGFTQPYYNIASKEDIITFSRRIFDDDGNPLAVGCLNIFLDRVKHHAINTQFAEKGYGFLLNQNMELIAHPDTSLLGVRLRNVQSYIAAYEDELREIGHIYELITTDYRGIKSIVFIERLYNGWYMGIVTPQSEYYQSTGNMAFFLTALGAALAMVLITILTRISAEKNSADERMRIMFNSMPLGANIHNKTFDYFDCNDYAVKMFGLSSKKEYRKRFSELSPEYQPDGELSSTKMAKADEIVFTEGYYNFEWTYQNLEGELIPGDCTLVRVKYNDEFVVAAYIRDLREIKAAIAKVREADERMQIMFDATPLGANLFDYEGRIIDCNNEAVRLFDMPNKQEYLKSFNYLMPEFQPDGRVSIEEGPEFVKKTFEEGSCRFEWIHQKLNGELIPCDVTFIRVKYKDDYMVAGYMRDLREHIAMLDEIHKENEKSQEMAHWYNSILNAIPLPITVTDADAKWTFINTAVEKFLGITLKDAIGKPCSNWNTHVCNTPDCGIACVKRGVPRTYFSHKDLSFQTDVSILKDLHGGTMGYIEVVQDITNLKIMAKKQAEAEAANIAKTAFLAKVSHEIRTPMNAILGITEIQLQNESLPSDMQEALGKIYNSGYLLLGIINDILDLSKIEACELELSPVNYDVPSLTNDIAYLNIMRFDSKPIVFDLNVDENIPLTMFGDELRIKQILNNLLSNAFKYTESGKVNLQVIIDNARQNKANQITLMFRVSDTGHGMTPEQLDKLFDEYTRFNTEANREIEGAGLGMSITKHLVDLMNGEISVESEYGKGSTFTVWLPQGTVDAGVLGKEMVENLMLFRLGRMSQMKKAPQIVREYMPYGKVLIVDDVETNLYVAKGLMAPYGLQIETVSSGFEAIDIINNGARYDIVFMDHFMPRMDGIEAAKKIRGLGYTAPIIALTANALAGQAEIFFANGFDDFISKPIDIRQLNSVLNKMVRDKYPSETVEAARRQQNSMKKTAVASKSSISRELAKIFMRDANKIIGILEAIYDKRDNYADDDIQSYIINVHAMKSALAGIGENVLSDFARKLEEAGRGLVFSVMSKETPAFLNALREVIKKITPNEDDGGVDDIRDDDLVYLNEKLALIQEACAEYDKKTSKKTLALLQEKTWPRKANELLDSVAENLLHSEFDEAAKLIEDFKKS
jgi:PAS domain S-box-containing protein